MGSAGDSDIVTNSINNKERIMRLSHLVYALTLIAYAVLQLGTDLYNMKLIWVGIILATVIWIIEGLVGGVKVPTFRRNTTA